MSEAPPPEELFLVRTSERTTFTRCRQKWEWAYSEELTPRNSAPALRFGSLIHEALAEWYQPGKKRGRKPWLTFHDMYMAEVQELAEFGMYADDEWVDALTLGTDMLKNYVQHYGTDSTIEMIAPEVPFQIDIFDPDTGEYVCTYVGTFDGIYRDKVTGKFFFLEHKTAKSIITTHLQMDEQAGSYWVFGTDWMRSQGILTSKQKLSGIMYNFLRKAKTDDRPRNSAGQYLNQNGTVSKRQPAPLFHRQIIYRNDADRLACLRRIINIANEMKMCSTGELEIYKNITRDCSWDCPFGGRTGMCEIHEMGDDWEAIRNGLFVRRDPYEAHEIVYEREDD